MLLSPLLYTIPVLIDMPCQVCFPHNVLVPSIIKYIPGFSSTPFTALLVAWPHVPLFFPQLSSTSVAMPFVVSLYAPLFLLLPPFFSSSIIDTPYIYVLSPYT